MTSQACLRRPLLISALSDPHSIARKRAKGPPLINGGCTFALLFKRAFVFHGGRRPCFTLGCSSGRTRRPQLWVRPERLRAEGSSEGLRGLAGGRDALQGGLPSAPLSKN